jgi:hypothetical protein
VPVGIRRRPTQAAFPKVLVHGEQTAMGRLKAAMTSRFKDRDEDVKIHTPRNLETLELSFRGERVAKVLRFHIKSHGLIDAIASRR